MQVIQEPVGDRQLEVGRKGNSYQYISAGSNHTILPLLYAQIYFQDASVLVHTLDRSMNGQNMLMI